eukprot:PhM_4_TR7990/c0_g3_i1/m.94658
MNEIEPMIQDSTSCCLNKQQPSGCSASTKYDTCDAAYSQDEHESDMHATHTEHHHYHHRDQEEEEALVERATTFCTEADEEAEESHHNCIAGEHEGGDGNENADGHHQHHHHHHGLSRGLPEFDSTDAFTYDDDEDEDGGMCEETPFYSFNLPPARSDWQYQVKAAAMDRQRRNMQYHQEMMEMTSTPLQTRRAAIHILIAEAEREARRTRCGRVTREQWAVILQEAMDDMTFADNSQLVLKNLSCMCIFVPGRQCPLYGDNPEDRSHRIERHQRVLERLSSTGRLFLSPEESILSVSYDSQIGTC